MISPLVVNQTRPQLPRLHRGIHSHWQQMCVGRFNSAVTVTGTDWAAVCWCLPNQPRTPSYTSAYPLECVTISPHTTRHAYPEASVTVHQRMHQAVQRKVLPHTCQCHS